MTTPEPVTVAEEFVYAQLSADSAVQAAFGHPPRLFPAYAPDGTPPPFVTHDIVGSDVDRAFNDGPPLSYTLTWGIAAMGTGSSRQQLRAGMQAILAALVGGDLGGRAPVPFGSATDGSRWLIATAYDRPLPEPALAGDVSGEGAWARLAHAVVFFMQPQ
jgi:hypothetical protein